MIRFVRSFAEGVKKRRRLELAIVIVLGLAGLAMGGTGPDPNYFRVHGPSHAPARETARAVHAVVVSARQAGWPRPERPSAASPTPPELEPTPPEAAPAPSARGTILPFRVRGPPVPTVRIHRV